MTRVPGTTSSDNPRRGLFRRIGPIRIGGFFLALMIAACLGSLPWTLSVGADGASRYDSGDVRQNLLPPWWWGPRSQAEAHRLNGLIDSPTLSRIASSHGLTVDQAELADSGPAGAELKSHWPIRRHRFFFFLGSDELGRSLLIRCMTGGGISLCIGIAAATLSVIIGTLYGSIAGYSGGLVDAVMMRIVDILYGLPYVLLVVLLAVAVDSAVENWMEAHAARGVAAELSVGTRNLIDVLVLLLAIGGVSWLTMARVVRGQVLSLKAQPFMEAARAMGVSWFGQFRRHLLPNLVGPVIVYATLTVPQAILQESFLSFLGIGVKPPMPSWGNLAAEGLAELNPIRSNWWLLVFPCVLLGMTLLALNILGEGLREALDPKRSRK